MSAVVSIDAARRLASVEGAKQVELATWDLADAVLEDVPASGEYSPLGGRDGSHQELKLLAEKLSRAGYDYSHQKLRKYRATAQAWPEQTRIHEGAGFTVHLELRGHEDRIAVRDRLMAEHDGRVTQGLVREWKRLQQPAEFLSWADARRRQIAAIAKQAKTAEAREQLADLLEAAARELRDG